MRIYVAGPVTGADRPRLHFAAAAHLLREAGYEPLNPTAIDRPALAQAGDSQWLAWMRTATRLLIVADGVALLPGWRQSRGALIEADWAEAVGLPVKDLEGWLP